MPVDLSKLPPSPFAHLPYDEKLEAIKDLMQQQLKRIKEDMDADAAEAATAAAPKKRRVAATVLAALRFFWRCGLDGLRNNRYRLPAAFYIGLFTTLWIAAFGMVAVGAWEGVVVAMQEAKGPGPACGAIPMASFYRIVVGKMIASLPLLVTMTIFLFPALVRP